MITLQEGNEEMLPYIKIEIEPGRWPFYWWYEVHYWDKDNMLNGEPFPCWVHHWEKDGGGWGLWRTWRKAQEVLSEVWDELT